MSEYNVNDFQRVLLVKIRKHPEGLSREKLIKIYKQESGVDTALAELVKDGFLERTESEEDKTRKVMGLPVTEFSGDYLLTDKANAFLSDHKYSLYFKTANYLAGLISGALIDFLIAMIIKIF